MLSEYKCVIDFNTRAKALLDFNDNLSFTGVDTVLSLLLLLLMLVLVLVLVLLFMVLMFSLLISMIMMSLMPRLDDGVCFL